ncbi:hypothetical protein BV898_14236 [Hypsibius exemplaris]|uniref:Uncharacterized protein n=1 Tax=Hypsibius exemplaris TaxID=2072580 RepID=A0A1W0W8E5_HYPEX|nr:hypothetical protein BV898_14236 [Hypsibius exemplaris]
MNSEQYAFLILDEVDHTTINQDGDHPSIYTHPSSSAKIMQLRDAVLTLHDLCASMEKKPKEEGPFHSSTRMTLDGDAVDCAVLEDPAIALKFILAASLASQPAVAILNSISSLLRFLSPDLRRSFLDAHFRSDVDGLIVSVMHSFWTPSPGLIDGMCVNVRESQLVDTTDIEDILMTLEAGDLFDHARLDSLSSSIYVVGSCLFVNERIVACHLPDSLMNNVSLFMKFHRKGFRRIKRGLDGASVVRYWNGEKKEDAAKSRDSFLIWTNFVNSVLVMCFEISPTRTDQDLPELLDIVIRALQNVLYRTSEILPQMLPERSNARGSVASASGSSQLSSAFPCPSSSITSVSNSAFADIPPAVRNSSSQLLYRIKFVSSSSSAVWETFVDSESRKRVLVPPSLRDDFLRRVSSIHYSFQRNEGDAEEVAMMLEYPAPALVRKYWISGWRLNRPNREVYICYPDGAEEEALLASMTT